MTQLCIQLEVFHFGYPVASCNLHSNLLSTILFQLNTDDPLVTHLDDQYLNNMAKNGVFADHFELSAVSRMLKRKLWVVTSQEQPSSGRGNLMTKVEEEADYPGDPILLGHIGNFHYISLGKLFFVALFVCLLFIIIIIIILFLL